jgi:hypothetical protein
MGQCFDRVSVGRCCDEDDHRHFQGCDLHHQLDGARLRERRLCPVAADTYVAEGIDSTLFDTFSTGTGQKLTFGNSITTAVTMTSGGGDFPFIDTTTIHTNIKTSVPGTPNAQTYTFDNLWDPADSGQIAMKVASDSQAQRAFKFTFGSGGPIMVFTGYVGFAGAPGGTAQDKVTTSAAITAFGTPTYYAS